MNCNTTHYRANSSSVPGDPTRGQTIAIVDAFHAPTIRADLRAFDAAFGLPDPDRFTIVGQDGSGNLPSRTNAGWAMETALDVEWAHAIAPEARILLVEANSASYADMLAAVDTARRADGVSVVSMSWGSGEFSAESSFDPYFTTPAGHAGVTFVASAGDDGTVSYPAVSSRVVAVGGTSLSLDQAGNVRGERVWNNNAGSTGGGISSVEQGRAYQTGYVAGGRRGNPDVAYDADPYTGFPVYDTFGTGSSNPWIELGGTSAGAPQWAALLAIANQARARANLGTLRGTQQTLPALYSLPNGDFNDVVAGNNGRYAGGAGYDLVTGRGTPRAAKIIGDLATMQSFPRGEPGNVEGLSGPAVTVTTPLVRSAASAWRGATYFTGDETIHPTGFPALVNRLREEGANVLRWQVLGWSASTRGYDVTNYAGYMRWIYSQISQLKDRLALLHQNGIRVVINLHVAPLMRPEDWCQPGQTVAMQNLFRRGLDGQQRRQAFYDAWMAISDAFKDDSRVVGYDLLNEPNMPPPAERAIDLSGLLQEVANRIRGPRGNRDTKLLIAEPVGGNPDNLDHLDTIKDRSGRDDPNVVYSFHLYYINAGVPFSSGGVDTVLRTVERWQERHGNPRIFVGELGTGIPDNSSRDYISRNLAGAQQFLRQCLNRFRANSWDWAYFEFYRDTSWPFGSELDLLKRAYQGYAI